VLDHVDGAKALESLHAAPAGLGILFGGLAVVAFLQGLMSSARQRRHDHAVLRSLGFTPRAVRTSILCQAGTTVVVAILIGLPCGIAIGRAGSVALTLSIGTLATPTSPLGRAALGAGLLLIGALCFSIPTAIIAARVRPASVLHTE